ncbi:MAG: DegV family protein [Lachnospiraceae bacterium]|nr:DegV family protein [Lachnospiraceae bacterium]
MNKFIITTDSTCDLPESYISDNNIPIIPLYYAIDEVVYGEEKTMEVKEFFDVMRGGKMPTTMAANQVTTEELFRKYLEEGYDILHLAFSSGLSSTYNTAAVVANELTEEYPDRKIIVIDTLAASMGEGLIVYKAVEMQKSGKTIDEISDFINNNIHHFVHMFTVDDLFHLHRGGRVSKATAIMGTMINIKPVLHVDNEGKLVALSKVRGRKKSLSTLVDNMSEYMKGYENDNDTVMISHGDCIKDAEFVANQIKERFGIENIMINYICPTIGAHAGPGTVALFFVGEKR